MFTGLIAELGVVASVEHDAGGARLRVSAGLGGELREGDSVSVNGACLTAAARGADWFEADVMNQTLELTTLGELAAGHPVNLEPALRAGDPLGGHIVQGHVDGVGEVDGVAVDGRSRRVRVRLPGGLERYVVEHGSITLDGVSLTVAAVAAEVAEVALIPETLERTTLGATEAGRRVNVELDVVARYVEKLVQRFTTKGAADG